MFRVADTGLAGHVRECSVTVVVVERIGGTLHAPRPALHIDPDIAASVGRPKSLHVTEIEVDIVGYKQIREAVAVIVAECCSGCPQRISA